MLPVLVIALICGVSAGSVVRVEQEQRIQLCPNTAPKVNVTLYYESLCGGCFYALHSQLTPFYNAAGYIANLTLLPYGNAKETKKGDKWVFKCQHGVEECDGNMVETCVLHHYPNMTQAINFIDCFEVDFINSKKRTWQHSLKNCAQPHGIDEQTISTCVTGDEGWQLEHEVATQTGDHEYVPWVIINGQHHLLYDAEPVKFICEAYTGTKPDYCKHRFQQNTMDKSY